MTTISAATSESSYSYSKYPTSMAQCILASNTFSSAKATNSRQLNKDTSNSAVGLRWGCGEGKIPCLRTAHGKLRFGHAGLLPSACSITHRPSRWQLMAGYHKYSRLFPVLVLFLVQGN